MTPQAPAFAFLRRSLLLWATTAVLFAAIAQAGINTRVTSDTAVFRVGERGRSTLAGRLKVGDQVEVLGFRTSFDWIRIRYQGDEGYIPKSAVKDLDLTKDYFDPAGDKLGRRSQSGERGTRSSGGPDETTDYRKTEGLRPAVSALLGYEKDASLGFGGAAFFRSSPRDSSGYDFGLEGLLYYSSPGTPFQASVFFRPWWGNRIKWGAEAMGSLTFIRYDDGSTTTTESASSVSLGAFAIYPINTTLSLNPGVRATVSGGSGLLFVLPLSWTF